MLPQYFRNAIIVAGLIRGTSAVVPSVPQYNVIFASDFNGNAGQLPDSSQWKPNPGKGVNDELETYTSSTNNIQLTGRGSLLLIPLHNAESGWTSGRVTTPSTFLCQSGKKMLVNSRIKLGNNLASNLKGMWPAFWALGENEREGTPWPQCGEWDIMETNNGGSTAWSSAHVGVGDTNAVPIHHLTTIFSFTYEDWHTWGFEVDRTAASWQMQTIKWYLDGVLQHTVSGSDLGDYTEWVNLTQKPFYLILNVAVGGGCPSGDCTPNEKTLDGIRSGMEVDYVAVYAST